MFSWATSQLDAYGINASSLMEIVAPVAGPSQKYASALAQGDEPSVLYALQSGELEPNAVINAGIGSRLIHIACSHNRRQVVDALIQRGVGV